MGKPEQNLTTQECIGDSLRSVAVFAGGIALYAAGDMTSNPALETVGFLVTAAGYVSSLRSGARLVLQVIREM